MAKVTSIRRDPHSLFTNYLTPVLRERFKYNSMTGEFVVRPRLKTEFQSDFQYHKWNDEYADKMVSELDCSLLHLLHVSDTPLFDLVYTYVFGVAPSSRLYAVDLNTNNLKLANITDCAAFQNHTVGDVLVCRHGVWYASIPTDTNKSELVAFDTEDEALAARTSALKAIRKVARKLTTPDGCTIYVPPDAKKRRVVK